MTKTEEKRFNRLLDQQLEIALKDVGPIKPWFDNEVQEWVFEHPLYPESCSGKSKDEVFDLYPRYLRQLIEQRLKGNLSPLTEKRTAGRGGRRVGAGRPVGTAKARTCTIRVPIEIGTWIKSNPKHLEQIRDLVVASLHMDRA
jgi:hypothetical protein